MSFPHQKSGPFLIIEMELFVYLGNDYMMVLIGLVKGWLIS